MVFTRNPPRMNACFFCKYSSSRNCPHLKRNSRNITSTSTMLRKNAHTMSELKEIAFKYPFLHDVFNTGDDKFLQKICVCVNMLYILLFHYIWAPFSNVFIHSVHWIFSCSPCPSLTGTVPPLGKKFRVGKLAGACYPCTATKLSLATWACNIKLLVKPSLKTWNEP